MENIKKETVQNEQFKSDAQIICELICDGIMNLGNV